MPAPVRRIDVIKGPSRPLSALREANLSWKLINQLSLNHLSLLDTDAQHGAAALREILRLYANPLSASARMCAIAWRRPSRVPEAIVIVRTSWR